jgi:hypothetical protein
VQKWVRVDLQGRDESPPQYISAFKIQYSPNGLDLIYADNETVYVGYSDGTTVKTNTFTVPFQALIVRLRPTAYVINIAARVEFYYEDNTYTL